MALSAKSVETRHGGEVVKSEYYLEVASKINRENLLSDIAMHVDGFLENDDSDDYALQEYLSNAALDKLEKILEQKGLSYSVLQGTDLLDSKLVIHLKKGEELFFDLYEIIKEKEIEKASIKEQYLKGVVDFGNSINVMEYLFEQNEKEWFGELDEEDKVSSDYELEDYRGKTLEEVGTMARENLEQLWKARIELKSILGEEFPAEYNKELADLEEKYLTMVMGIGDKYEGGARMFKKTETEVVTMMVNIVDNKLDIESVFQYMIDCHSLIDENHNQETLLQDEAYPYFTEKLNTVIFNRLVDENASDEEFLKFARLVSGRDLDMDGALNDPEMANKVLTHVMGRKDGIIEDLHNQKKIRIRDEELGTQTPKSVISEFRSVFSSRVKLDKIDGVDVNVDLFFSKIGAGGLSEKSNRSYDELDLSDKLLISTLKRFTNKLKNYEFPVYGDTGIENSDKSMGFIELISCLEDVSKDALQGVVDGLNDNFDGLDGLGREDLAALKDENGVRLIPDTELDIFDLYNDINGNGWRDLSDGSKDVIIGGAKFAGVVAGAILLTVLTAGAASAASAALGAAYLTGTGGAAMLNAGLAIHSIGIALNTSVLYQGLASGMFGSATSWGIFPQGYNTPEQMFVDLGSDLMIGGATGLAGGGMAYKLGDKSAKLLANTKGSWKNRAIFAGDLTVLGFGAEFGRMKAVNWAFDNEKPLFQPEEKDEIEQSMNPEAYGA